MPKIVKVATLKEIPHGKCKSVEIDGQMIALFNCDDEIYAVSNECTHAAASLCEGNFEGIEVTCPWHAARFDVRSGEALSPPAYEPLKVFKVILDQDNIQIEI